MFSFFFVSVFADTTANIFKIFNGNWSIQAETTFKDSTKPAENGKYYLKLVDVDNKTKEIHYSLRETNESAESLADFQINFETSGKFRIIQRNQEDSSDIKEALVELNHNVHPHVSATGQWDETFIFNIDVITQKKVQLTLFDTTTGDMTVLNMFKDVFPPLPLWQKLLPVLYFVVIFIVTQTTSNHVLRKYSKKLASEKKQELDNKNKPQSGKKAAKAGDKPKSE